MNKTLISYLLIIAISGTLGAAGGVIAKRIMGQEEIDYSDFNPDAYAEDKAHVAEMLAIYEQQKSLSGFSASDVVNIGLEKYRRCENSYSLCVGTAQTIVSQTIRNAQIKNGDEYFEESISNSSMVHVASRSKQYGADSDSIYLLTGEATGTTTATYPYVDSAPDGVQYSRTGYKGYLGKTLDEMFIYIISRKTCYNDACKITTVGDKTTVVLSLNPETSTYWYKIQMQNISGLDKLPTFNYVTLTYTFDSSMNLQTLHIDEQYKAQMGVTVDIVNSIDYRYHPNEFMPIPAAYEAVDYTKF